MPEVKARGGQLGPAQLPVVIVLVSRLSREWNLPLSQPQVVNDSIADQPASGPIEGICETIESFEETSIFASEVDTNLPR